MWTEAPMIVKYAGAKWEGRRGQEEGGRHEHKLEGRGELGRTGMEPP